MTLTHFVITQFCLRDPRRQRRRPMDPLAPRNVDLHLRLLETTCLPGLRAQTNRSFTWILLIDRALGSEARQRLRAMTRGMDRVRICEYRADVPQRPERLAWLAPLWADPPGAVVTTINDDDDSLPRRYVEVVQSHVRELAARDRLPPFKVIGARRIVQWDMVFTPDAPLGWAKPWQGAAVASCGFSLLCRHPAFAVNVLGLTHKFAETYCDFAAPAPVEHVRRVRQWLRHAEREARAGRLAIGRDAFFDASRDAGAVVMGNHGGNVQQRRLSWRPPTVEHEGLAPSQDHRRRVRGAATFPDAEIDWQAAQRHRRYFSPWRVRLRRLSHLLHKIPPAAAWRLRRLTGRLRARLSRLPRPEGGRQGGRA